ncbi:hypothetical protein G6F58_013635 [Rhizopus delemar]|nr:hypothetical protein G6F58_013635 [Rhizopus delemar]
MAFTGCRWQGCAQAQAPVGIRDPCASARTRHTACGSPARTHRVPIRRDAARPGRPGSRAGGRRGLLRGSWMTAGRPGPGNPVRRK